MKDDQRLHKLFTELRNDDKDALEKIYNEYKNLIYKIAFSILKNPDDAEDIVQIVIYKIFKLEKNKLPINKEINWLYTVTKNETFTFYKNKRKIDNIDDIYEIKDIVEPINKMDDIIYYNQIINKLKPIDKEIVSLKILSDFSFKMISKILNIPIGTVEWRYYKSVKYIKKSIITSIILVLALTKINNNNNELQNKEKELSNIISMKEKEEDDLKNIQMLLGKENANIILNENDLLQNIEKYEVMIKDINEDLCQIQKFNIIILSFTIIIIILIILNLLKKKKIMKKIKKRF